MLRLIIEWSVRNRFLVTLAVVFLIALGVWSVSRVPIDAIPDLSDVQVIIYTEYPGQSPRIVEDQVTYPLTTSMVSVPGSRVVLGSYHAAQVEPAAGDDRIGVEEAAEKAGEQRVEEPVEDTTEETIDDTALRATFGSQRGRPD
jgi:hypothetical protein